MIKRKICLTYLCTGHFLSRKRRKCKKMKGISRNNEYRMVMFLLVVIFAFLLIINFLTPLMGEDIALTAFPKGYQVSNLYELFSGLYRRIYTQVTTWNVRIGEQLSIVFSCFDKAVFNILNSIVTMCYFWLVYQYAFKRKFIFTIRNAVYLLFVFSLVLLFQPVLGQIFFWRTGSTNYLWGLCILLGFALPLRYYVGFESIDLIGNSKIKLFAVSIVGFFAGFTNENTII